MPFAPTRLPDACPLASTVSMTAAPCALAAKTLFISVTSEVSQVTPLARASSLGQLSASQRSVFGLGSSATRSVCALSARVLLYTRTWLEPLILRPDWPLPVMRLEAMSPRAETS
ncbi:hypothetical protein GCM10020219_002830 [Nonomuraea dietziae]